MARDLPLANGRLLVNFDGHGQVRDLYWPHVGRHNHTGGGPCRTGIWLDGAFAWLDDPAWERRLVYEENTLVTRITCRHPAWQLELVLNDWVDFHEDIFFRWFRVRDLAGRRRQVRLFQAWDLSIEGQAIGDTAYWEPERRAVIFYKGANWFLANGGVATSDGFTVGVHDFAVGDKGVAGLEGTFRDAEDGELSANPVAQGSVDGVVGLHLALAPAATGEACLWLAVGEDFHQVARRNRLVRERGPASFFHRSRDYWRLWVAKEDDRYQGMAPASCGLCRRSLLVVRTQIDEEGGIVAATDHDFIDFGRDTYAYVWPRDGALVADTLATFGYSEISRRFFAFCHRVITREGYLLHKYNPDGTLASSWHGWYYQGEKRLPVQEDETALVLWALWRHFRRYRDIEFVKPHYRGLVLRAADWLAGYRDPASGLPLPSWDLWEERYGVHAWTAAAVWAGLQAAAGFAAAFGQENKAQEYRNAAGEVQEAVARRLWSPEHGRFLRSLHHHQGGTLHPDPVVDISLVGLWYFGMFAADDPRIHATMTAARDRLTVRTPVGGMARYENDYYHQVSDDLQRIPGNPWFIAALWFAQWLIAVARTPAELAAADPYLDWAATHALDSGIMAEQVHPETGTPLSVSPLTWSHATYVETVHRYRKRQQAFLDR